MGIQRKAGENYESKRKENLKKLVGVSSGARNAIIWFSIQDPTSTTRMIDATAVATLCPFDTSYALTVNTLTESNASTAVVKIFMRWDTFIPHIHSGVYRAGDGFCRAVSDSTVFVQYLLLSTFDCTRRWAGGVTGTDCSTLVMVQGNNTSEIRFDGYVWIPLVDTDTFIFPVIIHRRLQIKVTRTLSTDEPQWQEQSSK